MAITINYKYICCPHLKYDEKNGFNKSVFDLNINMGINENNEETFLFLCKSCGERMLYQSLMFVLSETIGKNIKDGISRLGWNIKI